MISTKLTHHFPTKELICDFSNGEKYFILHTHSKVLTPQGADVTEAHLVMNFKENP